MNPTLVLGIDPGLVNTGVVSMHFIPEAKKVLIHHEAIVGIDIEEILDFDFIVRAAGSRPRHVFVEEYRPRIGFAQDVRMVEGQQAIRAALPRAKFVNNTGSKKVVKRELMKLLGVWSFVTPTYHQDLRSAARIAIFGMLKDDELNAVVTQVVTDHLKGQTWNVEHR